MATYRLVNPTRTESFRLAGGMFAHNDVGLTVLGSGSTLETVDAPTWDRIADAEYVFLGGHENTTTSTTIRDLWVANGYEVETLA